HHDHRDADVAHEVYQAVVHLHSPNRRRSPSYASMRRSRRNGQFCRVSSIFVRSHSTTSTSSFSADAFAMMRPNGSTTNDCPQKFSLPSRPTRFTTTTNTPFAIACPR